MAKIVTQDGIQYLEPYEVVALSKAVEEKIGKGAREKVTPGKYEVDIRVHVKGVLTVAEDTTVESYRAVVDVNGVLAAALSKIEKLSAELKIEPPTIAQLVACALKHKPETIEKVKEEVQAVIKDHVEPVINPRKGAVKASVIVEAKDSDVLRAIGALPPPPTLDPDRLNELGEAGKTSKKGKDTPPPPFRTRTHGDAVREAKKK